MGKEKFNSKEAACMLLANKLYSDYVDAASVIRGVEIEHFAEDWIARNLVGNDKMMSISIWRHFLERLSNHRNGGYNE